MPQKSILIHAFDNVFFIMDLAHVTNSTTEKSSTDHAVMCQKGIKM
jgi:hypothetical protein